MNFIRTKKKIKGFYIETELQWTMVIYITCFFLSNWQLKVLVDAAGLLSVSMDHITRTHIVFSFRTRPQFFKSGRVNMSFRKPPSDRTKALRKREGFAAFASQLSETLP